MNSNFSKLAFAAALLIGLYPAISQEASSARATQQATAPAAATATSAPNKGAVVIELYTSEGCSSCPPADDLLAKIEHATIGNGVGIIAMEEHIDYFNQEGWIDPFSSHEWTDRQVAYDSALHAGGPATPQMILDGQSQYLGDKMNNIVGAIQADAEKPRTEVTIANKPASPADEPHFDVTVSKLVGAQEKDTPEVWLVITETGLHSAVDRGENAGHELHHASVVRTFKKIGQAKPNGDSAAPTFAADASVKLNPHWNRENLHAVVLVQEKKSRHILGAAAIPIAK